jgi:glucosylceramidase
MLINSMMPAERDSLLRELFGNEAASLGISFLRISVGASDLDTSVFSYAERSGDTTLGSFSLSRDTAHLIPLLKQILAIRPDLRIMASPWSAPAWMKTGNNSMGGSLQPRFYSTYASYLVRYIREMKNRGIDIHYLTPQNEPLHGGNNPSMVMQPAEQAAFIRDHLGPAFRKEGISTRIVIYDHNCDRPDYPITILNDPAARQYIDGSAFHLYGGDISALDTVKKVHPDKNLYFTEQWTSSTGDFGGDLLWHMENVIIGSMQHGSRIALEWNLANDTAFAMHTPGGCTACRGALTIGPGVQRNVAYYIIAHASRFVPRGSVLLSSTDMGRKQVAFLRPDGKKTMIILNSDTTLRSFSIRRDQQYANLQLPPRSVMTIVW